MAIRTGGAMSEQEFQDGLAEVFDQLCNGNTEDELGWLDLFQKVDGTATFEDVGMLTKDRGLVVRTKDGAEFQITIVQSAGYGQDDEIEEQIEALMRRDGFTEAEARELIAEEQEAAAL